jgi:hypothetical protein
VPAHCILLAPKKKWQSCVPCSRLCNVQGDHLKTESRHTALSTATFAL